MGPMEVVVEGAGAKKSTKIFVIGSSSRNGSHNSVGYLCQADLLLSIGSARASNSDPRVAHTDFPVPPTTGMSSLNSVPVLLGGAT